MKGVAEVWKSKFACQFATTRDKIALYGNVPCNRRYPNKRFIEINYRLFKWRVMTYTSKNILQGYCRHFGVDWRCAAAEL